MITVTITCKIGKVVVKKSTFELAAETGRKFLKAKAGKNLPKFFAEGVPDPIEEGGEVVFEPEAEDYEGAFVPCL